jgi:hypothetical protein
MIINAEPIAKGAIVPIIGLTTVMPTVNTKKKCR